MNKSGDAPLGILTVKCNYKQSQQKLRVRVMNATQIKPMDKDGENMNLNLLCTPPHLDDTAISIWHTGTTLSTLQYFFLFGSRNVVKLIMAWIHNGGLFISMDLEISMSWPCDAVHYWTSVIVRLLPLHLFHGYCSPWIWNCKPRIWRKKTPLWFAGTICSLWQNVLTLSQWKKNREYYPIFPILFYIHLIG